MSIDDMPEQVTISKNRLEILEQTKKIFEYHIKRSCNFCGIKLKCNMKPAPGEWPRTNCFMFRPECGKEGNQ